MAPGQVDRWPIEGTRELLADLVGALIVSLEVEEGPDLRLIGRGTLSDRSTAAGIRTGRSEHIVSTDTQDT